MLVGVAAMAVTGASLPGEVAGQSIGDLRERVERQAGNRAEQQRQRRGAETGNTRTDRADAQDIEQTLDAILKFTLNIGALARAEDGAWDMAKQEVDRFRSEMDTRLTPDLIARANDTSGRATARLLQEAERSADSMATRIGRVNVDKTLDDTRKGTMFAKYGVPLSMRERLLQLQKLYPQSVAIREANRTAADVLAQLGTFDQIEQQADANYAALVASTRMYDAVRSDPALERSFVQAYWASPFSRDYAGGKVLKVHLTSRAWSVQHDATGRPVSRDQGASMAIRAPDGKCYMVQGLFEQKYAGGGGYGATYYRSGDNQEMLCENIPGRG
ncbi:MAG: hypothetical protein CL808_03545 [Citromicrobium sp.]|nr:hypothetical protein [Citromicrobium sp.]